MAKSATRMRFEQAYKEARDNGEKTFDFEGKAYNTRMSGEGSSSYGKNMASGARNKTKSGEDAAEGEGIRAAGRAKTVESEDMAAGSDMAASAARNSTRSIARPDPVTDPQTGIVPRRYGTFRTGESNTGDGKPFFTLNSEMKQGRFGTVRTGENDAADAASASAKDEAQKAEGMSRQKAMAEGFKSSRELMEKADESGYRKGGMVKKKSGGAVKMKSGGSVRGAGIAQRGQGKMRMC